MSVILIYNHDNFLFDAWERPNLIGVAHDLDSALALIQKEYPTHVSEKGLEPWDKTTHVLRGTWTNSKGTQLIADFSLEAYEVFTK